MGNVTEYFTGLAGAYARNRPTYPVEAIDFVIAGIPRPISAADVGCGTGISTRLLAACGVKVVGIDPNRDMLAQASQESADIEYRQGAGEKTGLPDGSIDLVVCAQSFHWFDPEAALREFHRVLKPAPVSRLALMWNIKDPTANEFSAGYSRLNDLAMADAARRGLVVRSEREADPTLGGFFSNVRTRSFSNPQRLDLQGVLGRMASASYFPKADPLRTWLQQQLRELFEAHQREGQVNLVHRTEVTLADRVV